VAISDLTYLHAAGDGGTRPFTAVVCIHATDSTASATDEASYASRRADDTSAHFYIDDDDAYRALPLDNIAYGCLWHGNRMSVQFELCGRSNQISDATMRRAAPLIAEVCKTYGIPLRKIGPDAVRAAYYDGSPGGVCGHADITAAFPEDGGDHTDPGLNFPWSQFMGYVLNGASPASEEDRMYQQQIPAGVGARVVLPFPYSADDHPGFSIATDTGPSGRTKAVWRVAAHKADVGWQVSVVTTDSQDGRRKDVALQPGTDRVSITRQAADNTDPCDVPASALAWW
jgi:N-acetyl-anhydromuramyl-L-alanine amidase AmpD